MSLVLDHGWVYKLGPQTHPVETHFQMCSLGLDISHCAVLVSHLVSVNLLCFREWLLAWSSCSPVSNIDGTSVLASCSLPVNWHSVEHSITLGIIPKQSQLLAMAHTPYAWQPWWVSDFPCCYNTDLPADLPTFPSLDHVTSSPAQEDIPTPLPPQPFGALLLSAWNSACASELI